MARSCDIPLGPLADEAPKYERPYVEPLKAIALTDGETARLDSEYPGFAPSITALPSARSSLQALDLGAI